ncbi:MAG: ribosome assembly cofactor RimP [Flavobacteriaceae bacterium]|nr:ribosome assembly cofactor RimP [Bacteroidia bacterium]NNK88776.1 ribosome assembly cofactor RimP [Flavobacteriaceae bacterium]
MLLEKVRIAIDSALTERPDLFLIDCIVDEVNRIKIVIDGDKGVKVDDCVLLSRAIEGSLDRETNDFSLEVSSAGATSPLTHVRQFVKNKGRSLEVKTVQNERFTGELVEAGNNNIKLRWKAREPKPVGKGKVTVTKEVVIEYEHIEQAKVKIKF